MKIHNLQQGTKEWFDIRKLKLTASHAQAIGNAGKGLETYVDEIMSEYFSSAEKDRFGNKDTERGHELEPFAREMYELTTGNKVEQVGFIEYSEFVGCSPDGLVGEDGGTEIKSLDDKGHYRIIQYGEKEIDTKFIWQTQMNLLLTGRKWWDLIFYNPNFKKSIEVFRIYPDIKRQTELKIGIEKGVNLIKTQLELWKSKMN